MRAVDTVLESLNIILFDFEMLGTILGTKLCGIEWDKKWNVEDFDNFTVTVKAQILVCGLPEWYPKIHHQKVWIKMRQSIFDILTEFCITLKIVKIVVRTLLTRL